MEAAWIFFLWNYCCATLPPMGLWTSTGKLALHVKWTVWRQEGSGKTLCRVRNVDCMWGFLGGTRHFVGELIAAKRKKATRLHKANIRKGQKIWWRRRDWSIYHTIPQSQAIFTGPKLQAQKCNTLIPWPVIIWHARPQQGWETYSSTASVSQLIDILTS